MPLELNSLRDSIAALKAVLEAIDDVRMTRGLNDIARSAMKSGAIKHFEFTYELCWKFMKRWLEMNISPDVAEGVTRIELFRLAAENLLIDDLDKWMRYHKARNLTSHTYDQRVSETVYSAARDFASDAQKLLDALEVRND